MSHDARLPADARALPAPRVGRGGRPAHEQVCVRLTPRLTREMVEAAMHMERRRTPADYVRVLIERDCEEKGLLEPPGRAAPRAAHRAAARKPR